VFDELREVAVGQCRTGNVVVPDALAQRGNGGPTAFDTHGCSSGLGARITIIMAQRRVVVIAR